MHPRGRLVLASFSNLPRASRHPRTARPPATVQDHQDYKSHLIVPMLFRFVANVVGATVDATVTRPISKAKRVYSLYRAAIERAWMRGSFVYEDIRFILLLARRLRELDPLLLSAQDTRLVEILGHTVRNGNELTNREDEPAVAIPVLDGPAPEPTAPPSTPTAPPPAPLVLQWRERTVIPRIPFVSTAAVPNTVPLPNPDEVLDLAANGVPLIRHVAHNFRTNQFGLESSTLAIVAFGLHQAANHIEEVVVNAAVQGHIAQQLPTIGLSNGEHRENARHAQVLIQLFSRLIVTHDLSALADPLPVVVQQVHDILIARRYEVEPARAHFMSVCPPNRV